RIHNERTVEPVESSLVDTAFGKLSLHVFHDRIQDAHHLALVKGSPSQDDLTTVRVHLANTMRDVLELQRGENLSWTAHTALQEVAGAEHGVFVLLDDSRPRQSLRDQLEVFLERRRLPRTSASDGAGNYLTIGTGSQILRLLGVGRMRLLSSPWKFSALSGFDLEVVEIIAPGERDGTAPGAGGTES
ncbi:MAG TPA: bifunctional 3,4-dihydroxy-2-butanone-4-phosphate synthase/GTP cyclohydrolase II, partial [Candidatus Halomonas stercoripullorum]|nr:bifunctional 3,4-dihydroxy-2-butanone-4-phosphate synthase/GTP cyclohydrolase II [Candidatus Halomonas stercoripullorum]